MSFKEVFLSGGGVLLVVMTILQIAPIQINPWGALARWLGRALNGDVLIKLDQLEAGQRETREQLEEHTRVDDERDANYRRQSILRFNADLMRGENYTHEHFADMLAEIDDYERYCAEHPSYKNNRAVMAVANIKRVYEENERDNSFLKA